MNSTKEVKAWVVLDSKGVVYAETKKPQGSLFIGSGRGVVIEKAQILRCTITYELPKELPDKE